ncbi:MAG: FMN-binding protein [Pseudomonadota bacterium]
MFKSALAFLFISVGCGLLLVFTADLTAPRIEQNRLAARLDIARTLLAPLPAEVNLALPISGTCDAVLLLNMVSPGYAGDIQLLARWQPAAGVAMRVVAHSETPGIGDFIDHTRGPWLAGWDDTLEGDIPTIDGIGRATITTNAIKYAFSQALHRAEVHCER